MTVHRFAVPALATALAFGCNDPRLVASGSPDAPPGSLPDAGAGADASPDAVVSSGVARLIAPLSTSTVTQQQPTLHWTGAPTAPTVELCLDRACAQPLATAVEIAADHDSGKVAAPLPPGWIFWRVHSGTQVTPTWQFFVGKLSATTAVDSSSGTVLDVNGDGYADLLIGGSVSAAYLYLGNPTGVEMERVAITDPAGSSTFGALMRPLGDVNGDGFGDFWVSGHMYLGGATIDGAIWNGTTTAHRIDTFPPYQPVAIGDVNGDGYADLYVPQTDQAYVWFGGASPDPANKITITYPPVNTSAVWGSVSSAAGDVNGDGYADFVVSDYAGSDTMTSTFAHLYLGNASPSAADWDAAATPDRVDIPGADDGQPYGGCFGAAFAPAGDINGDGYSDFAVGAYNASGDTVAYTGKVHIYLGSPTPATADWNGAAPTQRVDLVGAGYFFSIGAALSYAGDVNGDGYSDLVVGGLNDPSADDYGVGELYLGSPTPGDAVWNGASPPNRIDLTSSGAVDGYFAYSVTGGGDTDGDGYADFVVSATGETPHGLAHFFHGEAAPISADYNGTAPAMRVDLTNPTTTGVFGFVQ
jgi:hypothetical protein